MSGLHTDLADLGTMLSAIIAGGNNFEIGCEIKG